MNKFLVKKKKKNEKKKKRRVEKLKIFLVAPLGVLVAFLFYIRCTAF